MFFRFTHAGDARNEMAIRAAPKIMPELRQLEETLLQSLPMWNNVAQSSTVKDKQVFATSYQTIYIVAKMIEIIYFNVFFLDDKQ